MTELKAGFSEIGLLEITTYLNSGNVIFSSETDDTAQLSNTITLMISDKFSLNIPVHVVLQDELHELLNHAPVWWGSDDKAVYDNLIFLMPPLSYEEFYEEIGAPQIALEKIEPYKNAIFWSFSRKEYQKTNWWSKTANSRVSSLITTRTANTVKKIAYL